MISEACCDDAHWDCFSEFQCDCDCYGDNGMFEVVSEDENEEDYRCQCHKCYCNLEVDLPGDVCESCLNHAHHGVKK